MARVRNLFLAGVMALSVAALAVRETRAQGAKPSLKAMPAEWFWGEKEQRAKQDALVGQKPPTLNLSEWMNGEVKPEAMKGKIVLLDFWATWCGPCVAAIPHNNEIAKKYADKGVLVVGICGSRSGQEKMADVAKQRGIQYPIAKDATQESAKAWQVMWWPTYAIIDRNGMVRAVGLQTGKVEEALKAVLAEQPAPAS